LYSREKILFSNFYLPKKRIMSPDQEFLWERLQGRYLEAIDGGVVAQVSRQCSCGMMSDIVGCQEIGEILLINR
jgi:hypothetical protein